MIFIDAQRCTGCGACLKVCPAGALFLVDGRATVDGTVCRDCEACIPVCPTEAIEVVARQEPVTEPVRIPAVQPDLQVVLIRRSPALEPWQSRMLPAVGAALAWTGREILPWLADALLDALDRRASGQESRQAARRLQAQEIGGRGSGRQRRHRRRGGHS